MASRALRIEIIFKVTPHGYATEAMVDEEIPTAHAHGTLSRAELVGVIFDHVKMVADPNAIVRIYPNGRSDPDTKYHSVSRSTIESILDGELEVKDLCIGKLATFLETQMQTVASRLVPTRRIPGSEGLIECPHCGRGVLLSVCQSCGKTIKVITDKFRGPCVDLIEILVLNPEVDRLYVNQSWNPNPPWMSRMELFQMLREN